MRETPSKLINLLIGKSILETILVGTIAVVVHFNAFPPVFQGWGEAVVETRTIRGWVVNYAKPWDRVEVELYIDGSFISRDNARHNRPDVLAAGWSKDAYHGYGFEVPTMQPGIHEARVYAVHGSGDGDRYTLQLVGDPIKIEIGEDGTWKEP